MENYTIVEIIGEVLLLLLHGALSYFKQGSFGKVYKGRSKFSKGFVALKFITKRGKSDKDLRSLRTEIEILRELCHENIILLLDAIETDREFVLVTEYAEV